MKKFFKKPLVIIIGAVILIFIFFKVFSGSAPAAAGDIALVKRADIVQTVSITGTVKPDTAVDLGFEKSGTIGRVYARVGDLVKPGQLLVALQSGEAQAQFAQADADLKAQQAKLDELQSGTRPEELNVQSSKVAGANAALQDAQKNVSDKISAGFTAADEAVHSTVDEFFSTPRSANPKLIFSVTNSQSQIDAEWQRFLTEDMLGKWQLSLPVLPTGDIDTASAVAGKNLASIKSFLDTALRALNDGSVSGSISATDLSGWKSDLFSAQTSINTSISNLTSAVEKLKAARADVATNQSELQLDQAGTVSQQIAGQAAQVEKASANRDFYSSQLAKTVLRSPIAGTVTRQDAKAGEIAPANGTLVSLISSGQYEIEANIPESDIAKVKVGDSTDVTLDAYGSNTIFKAAVLSIDPAETMVDGVATYKVKFQFAQGDERIRSGMTANIDILTDTRTAALVVPQRAVASKSGQTVVVVTDGKTQTEVPVQTGLRGSDGNIEIISGLTEGQQVQLVLQ